VSETRLIGNMLVAAGMLSEAELIEALKLQEGSGKRLGELLVEQGMINELELTQILSNQLSVAWVSLDKVDFTKEILLLVPARLAREHTLIPVHFRIGDEKEKILYLAMDDPTNIPAMERIAEITKMHIRPMIAPLSEIKAAIKKHYFPDESE